MDVKKFENGEQATQAMMKFCELVLEAEQETGIAKEVILIVNVNVGGEEVVMTSRSGDLYKHYSMMKFAFEEAKKTNRLINSKKFKAMLPSDEEINQIRQMAEQ